MQNGKKLYEQSFIFTIVTTKKELFHVVPFVIHVHVYIYTLIITCTCIIFICTDFRLIFKIYEMLEIDEFYVYF